MTSAADNPAWSVRAAGLDDADALALIASATFLETFAGIVAGGDIIRHCARANSAPAFRSYVAQGARAWLAEVQPGAAPVGFALLTTPDLPGAQDGDLELKRIYALSRFHGTGLGAGLLAAAVAGARGFGRMLLGVYARNARAIAFYKKHGFQQVGERRFGVGGTLYDDVVLARPIPA